jgi:hypothetical protein
MDIYCSRCGEPWDNDCLHDEASDTGQTYRQVARAFQVKGCSALTTYGASCNADTAGSLRAALAGAAFELCGDDMDGASAMLEDYLAGY